MSVRKVVCLKMAHDDLCSGCIDTALVSNGNLLIQLDDGTVVNAGRVAGPQGPAGRDGQDGSPGIPGAKGDAGENGAKWHTGVGAPEVGLGENGDLYMDVANALLPIYQKVNRDWLFLANLKPTPQAGWRRRSRCSRWWRFRHHPPWPHTSTHRQRRQPNQRR